MSATIAVFIIDSHAPVRAGLRKATLRPTRVPAIFRAIREMAG